jgi:hypothetical protein
MIYGDTYFAKIAGGAQIGGDFNAHIVGKMYLAIEEPNKFGKGKLNLLKDLITSDKTEVNAKGINQYFVDDYTNYVFTCNYIPGQMLEEDDRRYFIIQHNGEKVGDRYHFEELVSAMEAYHLDFYKFLKMRDIKTFVFGQPPPQTGIKEKLMAQTIDPIFKYIAHLADTDAIEDFFKRKSDMIPVQTWKAFFRNAVGWCERECEEITWKKSPQVLRDLLKEKLGSEVMNFECVPVKLPDLIDGGHKSERCVLFPKNSDEVIDLLVRKKVYANMEETMAEEYESCVDMGSDPDDYETLLADEARKADIMEVNRMKENKIRRQYMKTLDQQIEDLKFDQE